MERSPSLRCDNTPNGDRASRHPYGLSPLWVGVGLLATIIGVVSDSRKMGKTKLLVELIRRLVKKGYRVATVKHISEQVFDTPSKDTWLHLNAGASEVMAVTETELVRIGRPSRPSLELALSQLSGEYDFVLIEGFKRSRFPKILIRGLTRRRTMPIQNVIATLDLESAESSETLLNNDLLDQLVRRLELVRLGQTEGKPSPRR